MFSRLKQSEDSASDNSFLYVNQQWFVRVWAILSE